MAEQKLFPSLSEDGWVDTPLKLADYLFSHIFLSDFSQSYSYMGYVTSAPWIVQETKGDIVKCINLMQKSLSDYFSRYFNNVEVEVSEVENQEDPTKAQLRLFVNLTDVNGNIINLGKMMQITDTKIEKIIDINNG